MLQVPEMLTQVAEMKSDREQQHRMENLKGQPIEEIINEQNMPRPVLCWAESKILSPSSYLAAAVYFFLYNTIDQKKTIPNQAVADLFGVSRSNLHRITSGRKYSGGSMTTGKKAKSLQELEEHGKPMVKIAKRKRKNKTESGGDKDEQKAKTDRLTFLRREASTGHKKFSEEEGWRR